MNVLFFICFLTSPIWSFICFSWARDPFIILRARRVSLMREAWINFYLFYLFWTGAMVRFHRTLIGLRFTLLFRAGTRFMWLSRAWTRVIFFYLFWATRLRFSWAWARLRFIWLFRTWGRVIFFYLSWAVRYRFSRAWTIFSFMRLFWT